MARPKTARLQTAYDLGHEHGRTGSRPAAADDVIGGDPGLQEAYDDGLRDGTDTLDAGDATPTPPRPRHRVRATSGSSTPRGTGRRAGPSSEDRLRAEADAHTRRQQRNPDRFSHPLHWGSGARGQVVGRPRLTPPRGLAVRDWTGFGFGLFLYALASSYISYGPGGPTAWLKAKFINDTSGAAALSANNTQQSPALHQLLVEPQQRAPQVAPPPTATPPGSLGFLFTQPTAPAAKP